MRLSFGWFKPKRLTLGERNESLAVKATEAEERAGLLERQAELRKRLLVAKQRQEKARSAMSVWKPGTLKWVLIVVAGALILFAMFKSC